MYLATIIVVVLGYFLYGGMGGRWNLGLCNAFEESSPPPPFPPPMMVKSKYDNCCKVEEGQN